MPSSPHFLVERSVRQCIDYTIFRQYKQVHSILNGIYLNGSINSKKKNPQLRDFLYIRLVKNKHHITKHEKIKI